MSRARLFQVPACSVVNCTVLLSYCTLRRSVARDVCACLQQEYRQSCSKNEVMMKLGFHMCLRRRSNEDIRETKKWRTLSRSSRPIAVSVGYKPSYRSRVGGDRHSRSQHALTVDYNTGKRALGREWTNIFLDEVSRSRVVKRKTHVVGNILVLLSRVEIHCYSCIQRLTRGITPSFRRDCSGRRCVDIVPEKGNERR